MDVTQPAEVTAATFREAPVRQLTPRQVDERARCEEMTLRRLRSAIPDECNEVIEWRSWWSLLQALAMIALSQGLLAILPIERGWSLAWQIPALFAAWCFAGLAFAGLFVLGHDCGHNSFSKSRLANSIVGHVAMGLLLTGLTNWVLGHNHHHKYPNIRKKDTNWPENMVTREELDKLPKGDRVGLMLAYGSPLGFLLGYWITIVRYIFMAKSYPQVPMTPRRRRMLSVSNWVTLGLSGGLVVTLAVTLGAGGLFKHYGAPVFVAAAIGAFLTLLHHSSEHAMYFDEADWSPFRGQVVSTFNVRLPRWFEAMVFDINIHLPHHLSPAMPWYHLRTANQALRRAFPGYVQERRLSLRALREMWKRPVLERAGDHYVPTSNG